uniref:Uncharacterized protein n=1 Tax=Acrobeloides nanus TaxID=290746 RepID=A0A914CP15_9BILA
MAPFEIAFMANVDPIGFKTYFLVIQPGSNTQVEQKSSQNAATLATNSMSNGIIQLDFDSQGYLSAFHDLTTGKTYPLKQEFMYYHDQSQILHINLVDP